LRGHAREHNLKLTDVAVGVADGTIGPGAITVRPAAPGPRKPRPRPPNQ
jgi:hypothetical protein